MNDPHISEEASLPPSAIERIDRICDRFEAAWQAGQDPDITQFLEDITEADRCALLKELLLLELHYRGQSGETMSRERYHKLFPDQVELVDSVFASDQARGFMGENHDSADPSVTATHDTASGYASTETGQQDRDARAVDIADVPEFPGYEVLELIGRGGMGLVLKARDKKLERFVAIKLPLPWQMTGADDRERFMREARSSARLRHANICPIHEVGEVEGRLYLVMDFIEGQSLSKWTKSRDSSPRDVAKVVADLAHAIHFAHQQNLVHRDIKPANVMIDAQTGHPVLMDFGLAKNLAEQNVQLTQSGQVMGTAMYMAPEQAAGRSKEIGPPADIYALGVVLYELLCGKCPFEGSFGEVLKQVQMLDPTSPRKIKPGLHRDLETICLKAMAKEPELRYDSAEALAEDLERFCAGEAIVARREPLISKVRRKIRRNPLAAASIAAVLLATIAGALLTARYVNVQRTAAVGREVDTLLNEPLIDEDYLRETEDRIAELEQFSPDQAADARRRLSQQFESAIREELHQATLPPSDVARIERAIELLEKRAADLAAPLRQALADRQRNWESIFQLTAPYSNAAEIFAKEQTILEDKRLVPAGQSGRGKSPRAILTLQKCPANVELHAVFEPSWSTASEIGLMLNASEQGGYRFVLNAVRVPVERSAGRAPSDFSFNSVKQRGGQVSLAIYRGNTKLTEVRRGAKQLGDRELRLESRREGNWLTFQVGDGEPLRFRDIFSVSSRNPGVFGLVWPEEVPLASLQGYRQTLPTVASPLERGDELFLSGRFSEARDHFRQQVIASADTPAAQEARHKEGLCLLAMGRDNEAAERFELVAAEAATDADKRAGDWGLLAACRLWLLRLRQKRTDDADAVYESLSARYRFDELAALVPEHLRREVYEHYYAAGVGINLLTYNPDRVRQLERAVQAADFLHVTGTGHVHAKRSLLRAYRLDGQIDKAIRYAEKLVRDEPIEQSERQDNLVEEYSWLMRIHGEPRRALEEVDRRLYKAPGVYREEQVNLLVERARLHAALEKWEEAVHDLDEYFRLVSEADYHYYSGASLIRGVLREREGDEAGAVEAWRNGYAAADAGIPQPFLLASKEGSRILLLHYMMLGSLSGEMTDTEAEALAENAFNSQLPGAAAAIFRNSMKLPPSVLREMWRTRRGRRAAEQLALQSVTFAEYVRIPILVTVSEFVRQNGFGHETSADDETIIWDLSERVFSSYQDGRLGAAQIVPLGLAWKGRTNLFGWGGVEGTLEPEMRASFAYVLGHRYLRLGEAEEAANFFSVAVEDAAPDSQVHRRAVAELAKLNMN